MLRWLVFIFVLTLLSAPSQAAPCLAELLKERHTYSDQTEPSVVLDGRTDLQDPRGARVKIRRLPGRSWYSRYASKPNAYQADPRSFIFSLENVEAAQFFGFEVLNDRQAIVPTAARMNWALDAIERASFEDGGEPIRFPIRMQQAEGVLNDRKYVEEFARKGSLPLAEGSEEMLHDLAYHAVAVLMPEAEGVQARRMAQVMLDFVETLEKSNPARAQSPAMQRMIAEFFALEGNKIDTGTGNLGFLYARGAPQEAFDVGVRALIRNGVSPENWLQGAIFKVFKDDLAVQLLAREFSRERSKVDPAFRVPFNLSASGFDARMTARRRRMISIIHRLQKSRLALHPATP